MATAASVFRDFEVDGVPASGKHKPKKSEIRTLLKWYEDAISALATADNFQGEWDASTGSFPSGAQKGYSWIVSTPGTVGGKFFGEGDQIIALLNSASTSTYAGNWVVIPAWSSGVVQAVDEGAGTANAIQITTEKPVSDDTIVVFILDTSTTGSPVTVSINGGAALTVKTNRGNDASALTSGMEVWGRIRSSDSTFRLLNDQDVSALVAQAEEAAAAAALYDGPKIDIFDELATVTPEQVEVGEYLRCVSIGAVYQRAPDFSETAPFDYTATGGCKWIYIPGVSWDPRAFGMTKNDPDNAGKLEAIHTAIWNYYNIPSSTQAAAAVVIDFGGGEYIYKRQVNIGTEARRGLILRGGTHLCDTTVTWGATDVLFNIIRSFTELHCMNINPMRMAGALIYTARNRIIDCKITNYGWVGVWQPNDGNYRGTTLIHGCEIGKYDTTSPEYQPGVVWPEEPAILIEGEDTEISDCQFRWSTQNIKVTASGGFLTVHGSHLYTGRANAGVECYNVKIEQGAKSCRFIGTYIDGGFCDVYNNATDFIACGFMVDSSKQPEIDAFVRLFAIAANQQTNGCQLAFSRRLISTIPFVKFIDNGTNTWSSEIQTLSAFLNGAGSGLALEMTNTILRHANNSGTYGTHLFSSQASNVALRLLNSTTLADPTSALNLNVTGRSLDIRNFSTSRMLIDDSGHVFWGGQNETSPTLENVPGMSWNNTAKSLGIQAANSQAALTVGRRSTTGDMQIFRYNGGTVGSISTNGTSVAYNTSSDYRVKTVQSAPDAYNPIEIVKQLADAQKWFTFDADPANTLQLGWLAHELQAIEPRAVTGEKDAMEDIGTLTFADGQVVHAALEPAELPEGATWIKTGERMVLQGRDDSKLIPVLVAALARTQEQLQALRVDVDALSNPNA